MAEIYCCTCAREVQARLTSGREIYPHRRDLADLPFWRCDTCRNHVGCHHKTDQPTRPLGCIPSAEISAARKRIHALIDPLWQSGRMKRREVYAVLGKALGRQYHTAELRTMDEVRLVLAAAEGMGNG